MCLALRSYKIIDHYPALYMQSTEELVGVHGGTLFTVSKHVHTRVPGGIGIVPNIIYIYIPAPCRARKVGWCVGGGSSPRHA